MISQDSSEPAITRREAIRRAALLVGVAVSPSWLAAIDRMGAVAQASSLTAAQLALTSAIADRIIPRTDTPGASDVAVPAFIDLLYGEFMSPDERTLFLRGLDTIAGAAAGLDPAGFGALPPDRQDALLKGIAAGQQSAAQGTGGAAPPTSFGLIRSAVIVGYFTSQEVGRNVLHYEPVPGRYESCVPLDEVGNRNWTT